MPSATSKASSNLGGGGGLLLDKENIASTSNLNQHSSK